MTAAERPRLVVLRALKLGDLLVAVPALRALARAFPDHHRVLAAPAWLEPLALLTGAVHEVVDTEPLAALDPSLRGAEVAVNLHGRGPESTEVLRATGPRQLVAFDLPGCPSWSADEHERLRWCRLLEGVGVPTDPDDLLLARPDRAGPAGAAGAARAAGATVVHPGASTGARRWPAARWAAVVAAEVAAGRSVVVTGAAEERELAEAVAVASGCRDVSVLAGRTDLLDLVALVADAGRVVCGDTGIAHVATATGTPSVVLFGPTSPGTWGPPPWGPHRVLWRGRTGEALAKDPDPGLLLITVEDVVGAIADLPERAPIPGAARPAGVATAASA